VDASRSTTTLLTVSGGGLSGGRTFTVPASTLPVPASWRIDPSASASARAAVADVVALAPEHRLWGVQVPVLLLLVAAALLLVPPVRARRRRSRTAPTAAPLTLLGGP